MRVAPDDRAKTADASLHQPKTATIAYIAITPMMQQETSCLAEMEHIAEVCSICAFAQCTHCMRLRGQGGVGILVWPGEWA